MNRFQKIRPFLALLLLGLGVCAVIVAGPERMWMELRSARPESLVVTGLLLLAANLVGALRYRILARWAGLRPPCFWHNYFVGNLGTLLPLPMLGQALARQWSGGRAPSPELNTLVLLLERAFTAACGGLLALAGAVHLVGWLPLERFFGESRILIMGGSAATTGLILIAWLAGQNHPQTLLGFFGKTRTFLALGGGVLCTALQSVCILAAYFTAVASIRPGLPPLDLAAACALISFCASFPVSFAGWGMRELAAIFFLGLLGMAPAQALAGSIFLGVLSLLWVVLLGCSAIFFRPGSRAAVAPRRRANAVGPILAGAWRVFLPSSALIALFYQFHFSFEGGAINFNFADPLAVMALAVLVLHGFQTSSAPVWRIAGFNQILVATGLLVWAGVAWATFRLGDPPLAATSRGLGWLVLLGYVGLGWMLRTSGNPGWGVRRAATILGLTATSVILTDAVIRFFVHRYPDFGSVPFNFEGFSSNRNAFAFQLLSVLCLLLPLSASRAPTGTVKKPHAGLFLPVVGGGVLMTGSRSGILCFAMILGLAWLLKITSLQRAVKITFQTGIVFLGLWILCLPPISTVGASTGFFRALLEPSTSQLRAEINRHAWQLWRESPWLGQGVGSFFELSKSFLREPSVIHNTFLNTLCETGVVGVGACLFMGLVFLRGVRVLQKKGDPEWGPLALLVALFLAFSQMHEISFQRIFWLLLGLLLAQAAQLSRSGRPSFAKNSPEKK